MQIDKIGEMLEWLKRHAWKACGRQKRLASSNLALSAKSQKNASSLLERVFFMAFCKAPPQAGRDVASREAAQANLGESERGAGRDVGGLSARRNLGESERGAGKNESQMRIAVSYRFFSSYEVAGNYTPIAVEYFSASNLIKIKSLPLCSSSEDFA